MVYTEPRERTAFSSHETGQTSPKAQTRECFSQKASWRRWHLGWVIQDDQNSWAPIAEPPLQSSGVWTGGGWILMSSGCDRVRARWKTHLVCSTQTWPVVVLVKWTRTLLTPEVLMAISLLLAFITASRPPRRAAAVYNDSVPLIRLR